MKDLPNGDRKKVIASLLKLRTIPATTEAECENTRIINYLVWQIRAGDTLTAESKTFLCSHKDVVVTDKSMYRIESPGARVHHVYYKLNPLATFYNEYTAVEYVAMLKGLL